MGFFNWIMNGLGFESGEGKKEKKVKTIEDSEDKYSDFNLHEKLEDSSLNEPVTQPQGFGGFGIHTESNIIMVEPKTFKDVQQAVDYLKQGQIVQLNLASISETDSTRILDFLSGAIYGVNGSIHRWHGDLFLLAPEGHKILKKE